MSISKRGTHIHKEVKKTNIYMWYEAQKQFFIVKHVKKVIGGRGSSLPPESLFCSHVAVHKVNLEVGTCCCLPLSAPHWAPNGPGRSREGYHI